MIKQFKEFKKDGRYLVSEDYIKNLIELIILEISEKGIKIKYDNGNSQWYLKDNFPYKFIEELPIVKQIIEDKSHEIQFDDDWYESDEPQFTLKLTEENDIEIKLKSEEKPKLEWENPSKNLMTWDEAMKYAKKLGDGWRLPTRNELLDAYDNDVQGFLGRSYWSSSTYAKNPNYAWNVSFYNGNTYYNYKPNSNYVCCVRDIPKEAVREPFWEIRDCLQVQKKSALLDDYNLGLYNGMEFCLAILEKREPKYKDISQADRKK